MTATDAGAGTDLAPEAGPFVHLALLYRSEEEYLTCLVPFITDGVAAGQPVVVAVPEPRLALLRTALGTTATGIALVDMMEAGRNPGHIMVGVFRRFADPHPDRHVRIVGEPIWPGRTDLEYPACVQHEALLNPAFARREVTIVCPYDVARLADHVLADVQATHPMVWQANQRDRSDWYDPAGAVARYNQPLNGAPDTTTLTVTTVAQLPELRRFVTRHGTRLGLDPDRLVDLGLIANELVVNSLCHAGTPAWLRLWTDHDHVVCEVRDTGQLADPLAGHRPPSPGQLSGRGLLLVHGLADLVRTHTAPHGTTIRALLRLNHP
jgi:anti-sigma regulatory factor (Ser/Thr protein kinase)